MTAVFVAAALLVVGGMAFAFALVRMADKPAPKPPLRLVVNRSDLEFTPDLLSVIRQEMEAGRGPYESSTVHGRRVPPTTDDRGLQ